MAAVVSLLLVLVLLLVDICVRAGKTSFLGHASAASSLTRGRLLRAIFSCGGGVRVATVLSILPKLLIKLSVELAQPLSRICSLVVLRLA